MKEYKGTNILVVGGAGFVGSNLVQRLLDFDPENITIIDNLLSSEKSNIPNEPVIYFIKGSITDTQILERIDDRFEYIFHLATYHGNQSSICNPLADHENNTLTTLKLYEWIKSFRNIKKVIYASAGCTVAEKTYSQAKATSENSPVSLYLDSPYQISKIIGEFYSNYYFMKYKLPVVKARFQNVYGPWEILGAGKWRGTPATVWRNVIPTFIYKALNKDPLTLENDGKSTRDFIFIDDIVTGLLLCATYGKPGEVYNLASGKETSISFLADMINKKTENPTKIRFLPKRSWDNSGRRFGSTQKAKKELGFIAEVELPKGLDITIDWTKDYLDLITRCISKHKDYITI